MTVGAQNRLRHLLSSVVHISKTTQPRVRPRSLFANYFGISCYYVQIIQVIDELSAYRCASAYEIAIDFCVVDRPVWHGQWNQSLVAQQFEDRGINVRQTVNRHSAVAV